MFILIRVIGVLLLIALNGFFVAAEFSLVSVRETRILQMIEANRVGARLVHSLHKNFERVLLGVQLGVTLASLALGWIGEPAVAAMVEPWIIRIPHAHVYANVIGTVIAFTLITYLHVVLGEIVPKSLSLHRAERVALAVAGPMEVFLFVMQPLMYLLDRGAGVVLEVFKVRQVREGSVHSPEELKLIVTASRRVGLLPEIQEEMIHRALEIGGVTVREIMVPRRNIFSLPADMSIEDAMAKAVDDQHSRIPVYDPQRGPEHIVGVLYSKDLARLMHQRLSRSRPGMLLNPSANLQVRHIMRDVLVVPETKGLPELLIEFKNRRRHLAVVVDEFGSTAGVVTVEDVLEQVVGEIEDEFDVAEKSPIHLATGTLVLNGSENLRDLESQHDLALPRDQGFETLAGFVLSRLQKLPRPGDSLVYQQHRFTVLELEGHRIAKVKIEAAGTEQGIA